jgi:hypothetical protein
MLQGGLYPHWPLPSRYPLHPVRTQSSFANFLDAVNLLQRGQTSLYRLWQNSHHQISSSRWFAHSLSTIAHCRPCVLRGSWLEQLPDWLQAAQVSKQVLLYCHAILPAGAHLRADLHRLRPLQAICATCTHSAPWVAAPAGQSSGRSPCGCARLSSACVTPAKLCGGVGASTSYAPPTARCMVCHAFHAVPPFPAAGCHPRMCAHGGLRYPAHDLSAQLEATSTAQHCSCSSLKAMPLCLTMAKSLLYAA